MTSSAVKPTAPLSLEQAVDSVRRHQGELDNAQVTYNFHTKMAASAFDEVKKHQRNLDQAQQNLARVASKTPAAAGNTKNQTPGTNNPKVGQIA